MASKTVVQLISVGVANTQVVDKRWSNIISMSAFRVHCLAALRAYWNRHIYTVARFKQLASLVIYRNFHRPLLLCYAKRWSTLLSLLLV